MSDYVLAIDQGTTSSRAIVFDGHFRARGVGQQEFPQYFPQSGWVEHEPEDIWQSVVATVRRALSDSALSARDLSCLGITNQRETAILWDRETGTPVHRAIVWQDRRTAPLCRRLVSEGAEPMVTEKSGLIIDPYFSATKIAWMLDQVEGARQKAESGKLAFGTVDCYLLWKLTGGKVHATDATNAARTLLFNIESNDWDDDLLRLFGVPRALLPEVRDCADDFGETDPSLFGAPIAIRGMAGDQHAAVVGQACFEPGMLKSTYGTGCFAVLNTGGERVSSKNRLLSTIAYRLKGKTTFALEGSIFIAGAAVQWLRDGLRIIDRADQTGAMAARTGDSGLYLVPAFTGLGAPWWDAEARGAIFGLTRNTGPDDFARAALEAVCYQTADLLNAMHRDWPSETKTVLRVDGGMVASDWTMQRLADMLDAPVDRPLVLETTALGAAWLAGQQAGVWPDAEGFSKEWRLERQFTPSLDAETRQRCLAGWRDAVQRTLTHQG
ncbi:glycerol kinase GlpK [Consotaella aegiceratis]|uniref:glycerol kinase GlpK n=1 Tax=Consotaella aegiceratis TaxID=3097961 RepID=UPI002F404CC1